MVTQDGVMFRLGDILTIYLIESTVVGRLIREDQMGMTLQDAVEKTRYRFIPWDRVMVIEYVKEEAGKK